MFSRIFFTNFFRTQNKVQVRRERTRTVATTGGGGGGGGSQGMKKSVPNMVETNVLAITQQDNPVIMKNVRV